MGSVLGWRRKAFVITSATDFHRLRPSGGTAETPFGEMVPPSVGGAVNPERSRCRPRLDDGRRGSFEQNYMQQ